MVFPSSQKWESGPGLKLSSISLSFSTALCFNNSSISNDKEHLCYLTNKWKSYDFKPSNTALEFVLLTITPYNQRVNMSMHSPVKVGCLIFYLWCNEPSHNSPTSTTEAGLGNTRQNTFGWTEFYVIECDIHIVRMKSHWGHNGCVRGGLRRKPGAEFQCGAGTEERKI